MNEKFLAYEYAVKCFLNWKADLLSLPIERVYLTKTQTLKLLFFVSAVRNDDGSDLLGVFNNFYAMQFGPVESNILDDISVGVFSFLTKKDSLLLAPSLDDKVFSSLREKGILLRIDRSISTLKKVNPNLVCYPATKLVEITHKWWCWKQAFRVALLLDRRSLAMSVDSIRLSNQVFT